MAGHGRQAATTSQLKIHDTSHNRHWLMQCNRIWYHVCSAKNKEIRTKLKGRECNMTFFAIPCFEVYHSKLHFGGSTDTNMVKWNRQMSVILPLKLQNWYFLVAFSWWNNGGDWGVDFTEGASWKNRDLSEEHMCVVYASLRQYDGGKKRNAWSV